jgi:hypothetical protein
MMVWLSTTARDAITVMQGALLEEVSEKLDVLTIDAKEDKAVRNPEIAITYITKPIQPPQFPLLPKATTLSLPKTTTSMQPLLLDESTVRLHLCPAVVVQDSELMGAIHEDRGPFLDPYDEYLEIENALPGCILRLRSSLLRAATTRRKFVVDFDTINGTDTINMDWYIASQYLDESYRAISISLVPPSPPTISEDWGTCLYPYESQWGTRWGVYRSRAEAHASVERSQAYDHAVAVRSAIILALDPDVDQPAWPVRPEYV